MKIIITVDSTDPDFDVNALAQYFEEELDRVLMFGELSDFIYDIEVV